MGVINNMIPILIYIITFNRNGEVPINSFIIGGTVTSFATFVRYNCQWKVVKESCTRAIVLIIV